jgi:hypothetical protein
LRAFERERPGWAGLPFVAAFGFRPRRFEEGLRER